MQLLPRRALPRLRACPSCVHLIPKFSANAALLAAVALAGIVVTGRSAGLQGPSPDNGEAPSLNPAADSAQIEAHSPGFHTPVGRIDLNAFNRDRKKAIAKDSEKLLGLTEALKTELDSDPGFIESRDFAQKVKEIEKLAHKVKNKMLEDPTPSRLLH